MRSGETRELLVGEERTQIHELVPKHATRKKKRNKKNETEKTGASNASKEKKQRKRGIKMMIFDAKLKAMRQYCYSIFMTGKHSPQLALEM